MYKFLVDIKLLYGKYVVVFSYYRCINNNTLMGHYIIRVVY